MQDGLAEGWDLKALAKGRDIPNQFNVMLVSTITPKMRDGKENSKGP